VIHDLPRNRPRIGDLVQLPRVNLFIADDTGRGKTIEAWLIARELLLRKKAKTIAVAAPPSVS
jgi:SNF2 family DNA or RNA helicase